MACRAPLIGWRSKKRTAKGKRTIVFKIQEGLVDMPVQIPCGLCTSCRLQKSKEWAIRCMHESENHEKNCFITLTYNEEQLPENDSLRKTDFTKFMKRLRAYYAPNKVRYFHCGEYGDLHGRPHYHALLFGLDFDDKRPWTTHENSKAWRSRDLEKLWTKGNSEIGELNFESAAYVARYAMKKYMNPDKRYVEAYYEGLEPEYSTMSRNPGIGKGWYKNHKQDLYNWDSVIVRGKEMKVPRYYDTIHEQEKPAQYRKTVRKRLQQVNEEEQRGSRALARATVEDAKLSLRRRGKL